jgi:hypothetical protein
MTTDWIETFNANTETVAQPTDEKLYEVDMGEG